MSLFTAEMGMTNPPLADYFSDLAKEENLDSFYLSCLKVRILS